MSNQADMIQEQEYKPTINQQDIAELDSGNNAQPETREVIDTSTGEVLQGEVANTFAPPSMHPPAKPAERSVGVFDSLENFELAQRMSKMLSASSIVPNEFQNNIANCMIAMEIAGRLGASPTMVMQNLYIVHGKPGWSSQYIIAGINASGRFSPLEFEFTGDAFTDNWGCRAVATSRETGRTLTSPLITIHMAKEEGWYQKKGSKWQTMPELMLRYRAGSFFGKLYAPDILLGMQTAEEQEDIVAVDGSVSSRQTKRKPSRL